VTDAAHDIKPDPAPQLALVRRSPFDQLGDLTKHLEALDLIANALCKATILPPTMQTPANLKLVLIQGLEMGFTPIQAIRASFVITSKEGSKVGYYVDSLVALVRTSNVCRFFRVEETTKDRCKVTCARTDEDESVVHSFEITMVEAKARGLDKKNEWNPETRQNVQKQKYVWITAPADMLRARTQGLAVKSVFQDVVFGMSTGEELDDLAAAEVLEKHAPGDFAPVPTAPRREQSPPPANWQDARDHAATQKREPEDVVDAELVEDPTMPTLPVQTREPAPVAETSGDPGWDEALGVVGAIASVDTKGWFPEDVLKLWDANLGGATKRVELNALAPIIGEFAKRSEKSKTCADVAARLRVSFNAATQALRKSEKGG
jgi:hypothetical protein